MGTKYLYVFKAGDAKDRGVADFSDLVHNSELVKLILEKCFELGIPAMMDHDLLDMTANIFYIDILTSISSYPGQDNILKGLTLMTCEGSGDVNLITALLGLNLENGLNESVKWYRDERGDQKIPRIQCRFGFRSHPDDVKKMQNTKWKQVIVDSVVEALRKFEEI